MGVEWGQLTPQTMSEDTANNPDYLITSNPYGWDIQQQKQIEGEDSWDVKIKYNPFRILLYSNGQILVVINNEDTLFFESGTEAV